jgi:hypothetical protein
MRWLAGARRAYCDFGLTIYDMGQKRGQAGDHGIMWMGPQNTGTAAFPAKRCLNEVLEIINR